jgi:hypothetical protein
MTIREIWSRLPAVVGDLIFTAANRMLDGVEAMLNGAITRINSFTTRIRDALAAVGIESSFGEIGEISLGDISNPFADASFEAGAAAAEAFRQAFSDNPLSAPDLGLDQIASNASATARAYKEAAEEFTVLATAPLTAWRALRDAISDTGADSADALDGATASAERLGQAVAQAGTASVGAGAATNSGWRAVSEALKGYASDALNWGKTLGETLSKAFSGAESAFRSFVETGKLDFRGMVRSILADLAVLQFRRAVLGPIASALGGIFGGSGAVAAAFSHNGGMVGISGHQRSVPSALFAEAPRLHRGGWAGLRPDEVPTILQRGERVFNREEAGRYAPGVMGTSRVNIHIDARGAQAGVAEQIDLKLRAALPEIARIATQSVANQRRRGHAI